VFTEKNALLKGEKKWLLVGLDCSFFKAKKGAKKLEEYPKFDHLILAEHHI